MVDAFRVRPSNGTQAARSSAVSIMLLQNRNGGPFERPTTEVRDLADPAVDRLLGERRVLDETTLRRVDQLDPRGVRGERSLGLLQASNGLVAGHEADAAVGTGEGGRKDGRQARDLLGCLCDLQ